MVLLKQDDLPLIESEQYVDVTQIARQLGFAEQLNVYVSQSVWKRYIAWTTEDDELFHVQQLQHERKIQILGDVLNLLVACNKEIPDKESFFNRQIIVRGVHSAHEELALFKLYSSQNEHEALCLIVDTVSITQQLYPQETIWECQLLKDMVERVLCVDDELSENMQLLDDLLEKDDEALKAWLTINGETEYPFMLTSARKIFTALHQYFDKHGDFTQNEQIILTIKKELMR